MAGIETVRTRRFAFSLGAATGALLLLCVAAMLAAAVPTADAALVPDSYIVVLKDDVAHPANVAERHEENRGADVEHVYRTAIEGYSAELTPGELQAVKQDPNVDYVEQDHVIHTAIQNPSTGILRVGAYANPKLDIDEKDDAPINADIAILDTGVAPHSDLNIAGRTECVGAYNNHSCEDGTGFPISNGHGTHVAGIAAARDNNFGVVGTAPGARIWSVRVTPESGQGTGEDLLAGIDWVTAHSSTIEVVNISLSCVCTPWQTTKDAINGSIAQGVVYVVSAGNDSHDAALNGPASIPAVITVSAITDFNGTPGGQGADWCEGGGFDDWLAAYSNYGAVIDIAAPGDCINSTWVNGQYVWREPGIMENNMSGTSMAAPFVAGAAAVMASQSNPENAANVEAIRNALRSQGSNKWNDTSGDGVHEPLLDMTNLTAPTFPPPPPPPPVAPPTVTTEVPSEVGPTTAKLNGSVYPNGSSTRYYFQYGTTTAYGNTIPASPGMDIGSGWGYVYTWNKISGLQPGTVYYFRNVATNAGGTTYGANQTIITAPPSRAFFIDANNGSNLSMNTFNASGGLETTLSGHSAASERRPAVITWGGRQHVFYVDATFNNSLSFWAHFPLEGKWQPTYMYGDRAAPRSSPAATVVNGIPHVFFVDADRGNKLTDWTWNPTTGWQQVFLASDPVAAGTSPTVVSENGDIRVFFVNASKGNTISSWVINQNGSGQTNFGGDPVAAGSSPSAVKYNGDQRIFFVNASKSNTVSCWVWNAGGIGMTHFGGPPVAANSSPSVINNKGDIRVYFSDASRNRSISAWVWNQGGIGVVPFYGDQVTPGSSPSALLHEGSAYIYFSDANRSNKLSVWVWGSSIQQIPLNGHSLTEGTTPGATGSY